MSAALATDINLGKGLLCFSQIGLFRECVYRELSRRSPPVRCATSLTQLASIHARANTHRSVYITQAACS